MTVENVVPGKRLTVRQALQAAFVGSEFDFTHIPISRAVLLLAIPMVLEMAMESLFGLVDILFVARLGATAVAIVGLTENLLAVVFSVGTGLAMAATALVARRVGEKDPEGASRAAFQVLVLGFGAALMLAVAGVVLAPQLLRALGAGPEVLARGTLYTRVMLGSQVSILLLFVFNGIFRGAGDAAMSMRSLWLANLVNLALDPCLIFGLGFFPKLGVLGAAVATTTGRTVGVLYQVASVLKGSRRIALARRHLRIEAGLLWTALKTASGATGQFLVTTVSWAVVIRVVARFGSEAIAGYTIAIRIIIVAILPAWGMANAASTLVGQNLGAKKPERAEQAVWRVGFYNLLFLGSVAVLFIAFAEPILGVFTRDPSVLRSGVSCLRYVASGYGLYAYGMVMMQAFYGAGDSRTPLLVSLLCYWVVQIPCAILLARTAMGERGVYLALPIGESLNAVLAVVMFRRGRWKTVRL